MPYAAADKVDDVWIMEAVISLYFVIQYIWVVVSPINCILILKCPIKSEEQEGLKLLWQQSYRKASQTETKTLNQIKVRYFNQN